jgi:four helix bundle protein
MNKFEDLTAWLTARKTVDAIYDLTRSFELAKDFGLKDQLQRASVSVMTNIAEGFERVGVAEKLHFYNISRASCGEVRSLLYVVEDNYPNISDSLPPIRDLVNESGSLLSGLIGSTRKRIIGKATGLIAAIAIPASIILVNWP